MSTALISVLVSLAAALLRVILQQRQAANDAHAVGRLTGALANLEAANAALKWKVAAGAQPDRGATLRVREPGKTLELSDSDSESDTLP